MKFPAISLKHLLFPAAVAFSVSLAHAAGASGNGASAQGVAAQGAGRSGGASSPAGGPRVSPGLVGGSGASFGQGSTSNERAGYLGGRTTNTDPGDGSSGGADASAESMSIALQRSSCNGVVSSRMTDSSRMEAPNLARFRQAESLLGNASRADEGADYLLANYQEELAKPNPDISLVGTYVGLVAEKPVTVSAIEEISSALCVPVDRDLATSIARAAENQRIHVRHGRR